MFAEPTNQPTYLPLFQTLAGGLLSLIGGIIGILLTQWTQKKNEKTNLSSAFYGEITAILSIIEKRNYLTGIKDDLKNLDVVEEKFKAAKEGLIQDDEVPPITMTTFTVTFDFAKVYDANIGKLGLLTAPLPEQIVKFYTFLNAALEDFKSIGSGDFNDLTISETRETLNELLEISNTVINLGKEIQRSLKN